MTTDINALIAGEVCGFTRGNGGAWKTGNGLRYFHPESSISDAMEALEHWRGQGADRHYVIWSPVLSGTFDVSLHDGIKCFVAADASVCWSICAALLKAHGIEVPK